DGAQVGEGEGVAGRQLARQVAGVAEEGAPVPERAGHHVAALDLRHAAARQLELVVGGLVGEHAHRDHHPLVARDVAAHPHLALELAAPGDRSDLVELHGLHAAPSAAGAAAAPGAAVAAPGAASGAADTAAGAAAPAPRS